MKIKNKIFFNLFFLSIFSLLLAIGFLAYFARSTAVNTVAGYNFLLAQNDMDDIDRFIDRRVEQWEVFAKTNVFVKTVLADSNLQFENIAERDEYIKAQDQDWIAGIKNNTTTVFMSSILQNELSRNLQTRAQFYANQAGYNIFPEVFVTNRYGALVGSTNKTSDYLQSDEEWWQKAQTENLWIGDLSLDDSSGIYGLEFGIKIEDQNGNLAGVIKVVYDIKDVSNLADAIAQEKNAAVHSGSQLGFTRKTVKVSLLNKDKNLIYSTQDGFGNLKVYNHADIVDEIMKNNDKPYLVTFVDGVEKLFSHGYSFGYGDYRGLGWMLIVEKDTQEVLAPLINLSYWLFLVIIFILILVFLVSIWLANSFNKPISSLMKAVKKVQSGDFDTRVETVGRDEIGQLARAFGEMVEAVKTSRAEVDDKVAQQTTEIRQKNQTLAEQQQAILNILEDVEKEKTEVERERDKTNIILHSIGDGVLVVDKNLNIVLFNEVAAQISGFTVAEALGKKYSDILKFIFEKDETINDVFIKEAISSGQIKEMANHTVLIRKDGSRVPVADSAAPLKDKKGNISGCVVVFRDVTREREIDRAKSEFVSVASHQLRTPLTGIKWFTELLLKNNLDPTTKDYVQQIAVSNERMVQLVNDLLNVSRIETGRNFEIILQEKDIVPIIKDVINEQLPGALKKHVSLVCDAKAPHELVLKVDELKIRQVFQNLVSNAIKYSKDNGTIILGCENKGDMVEFYVRDNGIGIPKGQERRIFEKFFRAENALTAHTDGTGLGLYIVKAIAEAHGGRVRFETKEGEGSVFYVSLPLKK